MGIMRIAAIQYQPPKGKPAQARRQLTDASEQAASDGAGIVVCPEMATTGYIWPDAEALLPHAEPAQGPTAQALSEVARRHGSWIFCGFAERDGETLYNSMLILGPDGSVLQPYRKVCLYVADEAWAAPGRQRLIVQTEHGLIVPGICMDINDPGFTDLLQQQSPRFCAFSTNWVEQGEDPLEYWRMRLSAFSGHLIAANAWGEDGATGFTGLSTILGPGGEVLGRSPKRGDHILMADTDD